MDSRILVSIGFGTQADVAQTLLCHLILCDLGQLSNLFSSLYKGYDRILAMLR